MILFRDDLLINLHRKAVWFNSTEAELRDIKTLIVSWQSKFATGIAMKT